MGSVSAAEDEDTLTGHLGANLQSGKRSVQVKSGDLSGIWKWSLDYYKFRGRGPRATEAYLGADGIFELSSVRFSIRERKSLLFQAKISETGKERLLEQCLKLSTWRESAFVMVYAPDGFFALSIDDVIQSRGDISSVRRRIPLEVMLGDQFLDCDVGDFSLRYEAKKHTLLWQAMNEEIVGTRFSVKHRLRLNLEVLQEAGIAADKMIDPKTVFRYRLKADDEDLLGVGMDRKPGSLTRPPSNLRKFTILIYLQTGQTYGHSQRCECKR